MASSGLRNGEKKFSPARKVRYLNAQKELGVQKKTGGALSGLLSCFIFWSYYNHLLYGITDYKMTTLNWAVWFCSKIEITRSQSCSEGVGSSENTGSSLCNVISMTYVVFYRHNTQVASQNKLKQCVSGWQSGLAADLRHPSLRCYAQR